MCFPNGFMEEINNDSNDYVEKRRILEPNIKNWYQKQMSWFFDLQSFYHLLALILYMGAVSLPRKKDHWKDYNYWPYQPIINEIGMS